MPERANELARTSVVLFIVDVSRSAVLALVDRAAIRTRQLSTVRLAIRRCFAVNALLLVFELRGFTCRQLSALDTLRDAVLLILLALADFTGAVVLHSAVVLVVVDLVRQVILLVVEFGAVRGG